MKYLSLSLLLLAIFVYGQSPNYVEGEILVQFKDSKIPQRFFSSNPSIKQEGVKQISKVLNIWKLKVNRENFTEKQAVAEMYKDPNVIDAQLNHIVQKRQIPNDQYFYLQWNMYSQNDKDIDADLAWDITTGGKNTDGDEIVIAIIDSGLQIDHPDMEANVYVNPDEIPGDGIDNDNNGYIDDVHGWHIANNNGEVEDREGGHGTSVAGVAGAVGNNGILLTGVNWNVKIMMITLTNSVFNEAGIVESYDYALKARIEFNESNGQKGAFVVTTNSSFGEEDLMAEDAPLWCNFFTTMGEHGILSAGATSNIEYDVDIYGDMPSTCPSEYLIATTAVDDDYDLGGAYGEESIDLGAPGTWIRSLDDQSGGDFFGGTSGATPHVSGAIALLYSAPCENFTTLSKTNPSAAALKMREYILGGVEPYPALAGVTVTGGMLNVNNSLLMLMEDCENVLGTNDIRPNLTFRIYPNPAKENLTIESGGKLIENIKIFGMDGKLVKAVKYPIGNIIDINSLPKGTYQLQIKFQNEKSGITRKFIKN